MLGGTGGLPGTPVRLRACPEPGCCCWGGRNAAEPGGTLRSRAHRTPAEEYPRLRTGAGRRPDRAVGTNFPLFSFVFLFVFS